MRVAATFDAPVRSDREHGAVPFAIERHDALASTSDMCIDRARAGAPAGLAILASTQTGGRGSHGRRWHMGRGNLALSVLLRPRIAAAQAPVWSLLAGLAVIEALSAFTHEPRRLQLKWPNDITRDGAKLAGVLIDSATAADGMLAWLVIGIGANLAHAPDLPDRPTACLGATADPEAVAQHVLARLYHWQACLEQRGLAPIRTAWLACAHPPGTALRVQTASDCLQGTFAGLAASGALLLHTAGGLRTLTAGELLDAPRAS